MNPIDLLTRLADALETELDCNGKHPRHGAELLAEARRAIKEWRVIEVPGCRVVQSADSHGGALAYLHALVSSDLEDYWQPILQELPGEDVETRALQGLPHESEAAVTIIVRVGVAQ